jgi:hypothetical protein
MGEIDMNIGIQMILSISLIQLSTLMRLVFFTYMQKKRLSET